MPTKKIEDFKHLLSFKKLSDVTELTVTGWKGPKGKKKPIMELITMPRFAFMYKSLSDYQKHREESIRYIEQNEGPYSKARNGLQLLFSESNMIYYVDKLKDAWYGTQDLSKVRGEITEYLFNDILESWLETVKKKTVNIDVTDIDQVKKIEFTDKEIGVFSFDLASLGLIRVYEYWSPVLKSLVSPNNVITERGPDGQIIRDDQRKPIFWHKHKPEIPEHSVAFEAEKGGFYSRVLQRVVERLELEQREENGVNFLVFPHKAEIEKHIVVQRQKIDQKGKPVWSTTFKKCFIHLPKIPKVLPRIDIIVNSGYNWKVHAKDEMPYSSVAAIALAEKLSKANANYRIIVVKSSLGHEDKRNMAQAFSMILAKKEGEALDKNKIALLISDARNYRLNGLAMTFVHFNQIGHDSSLHVESVVKPINDKFSIIKKADGKYKIENLNGEVVGQDFESYDKANDWFKQEFRMAPNRTKDAYMDYLKASDDADDRAVSNNPDSKIVFSGALSEAEAIAQYEKAIQQITRI